MKAKDLKVDGVTEYFYHIAETWTKGWGGQGERAVVVDATPGHYYRDRDGVWTRSTAKGGSCVLVDLYPSDGRNRPDGTPHEPRRQQVRSQTLRGTWDECVGLRRQRAQEKADAATALREQMAEIEAPCDELVGVLARLGIEAAADSNHHYRYAKVTISHQQAPALLAAVRHLVETGWRPPAA